MKKYILVKASSLKDLESAVNKRIEKGGEVCGAFCAYWNEWPSTRQMEFVQPMFIYPELEKSNEPT